MPSLGPYSKAITAIIGLVLTYLTQFYGTNQLGCACSGDRCGARCVRGAEPAEAATTADRDVTGGVLLAPRTWRRSSRSTTHGTSRSSSCWSSRPRGKNRCSASWTSSTSCSRGPPQGCSSPSLPKETNAPDRRLSQRRRDPVVHRRPRGCGAPPAGALATATSANTAVLTVGAGVAGTDANGVANIQFPLTEVAEGTSDLSRDRDRRERQPAARPGRGHADPGPGAGHRDGHPGCAGGRGVHRPGQLNRRLLPGLQRLPILIPRKGTRRRAGLVSGRLGGVSPS